MNVTSDAVEDATLYREKHDEMTPKVQYCLYNIQSMGVMEGIEGEEGDSLFQELDSIIADKTSATTAAVAGCYNIVLLQLIDCHK